MVMVRYARPRDGDLLKLNDDYFLFSPWQPNIDEFRLVKRSVDANADRNADRERYTYFRTGDEEDRGWIKKIVRIPRQNEDMSFLIPSTEREGRRNNRRRPGDASAVMLLSKESESLLLDREYILLREFRQIIDDDDADDIELRPRDVILWRENGETNALMYAFDNVAVKEFVNNAVPDDTFSISREALGDDFPNDRRDFVDVRIGDLEMEFIFPFQNIPNTTVELVADNIGARKVEVYREGAFVGNTIFNYRDGTPPDVSASTVSEYRAHARWHPGRQLAADTYNPVNEFIAPPPNWNELDERERREEEQRQILENREKNKDIVEKLKRAYGEDDYTNKLFCFFKPMDFNYRRAGNLPARRRRPMSRAKWDPNLQLIFKVRDHEFGDAEDGSEDFIQLDYGRFFDVPCRDDAESAGASLTIGPERDLFVVDPQARKSRLRTYLSARVHKMFQMEFVSPFRLGNADDADDVGNGGESQDDINPQQPPEPGGLKFLLNGERCDDRNQFIFWQSQSTDAARIYLYPIRDALFPGPDPGLNPDVKCAPFISWINAPLLKGLRRARACIEPMHRAYVAGGPPVSERNLTIDLEEPFRNDNIGNSDYPGDFVVRDAASVDVPRDCTEGDGNIEDKATNLSHRVRVTLWAYYNALRPEMRDSIPLTIASAEGNSDDEGDHQEAQDDSLFRTAFPMESSFCYHFSSVSMPPFKNNYVAFSASSFTYRGNDDDPMTMTTYAEMFATTETYSLPNDGLARVFKSNLLVPAQIGPMQSYIGTRVHLRLSVALGNIEESVPPDANWVRVARAEAFAPGANIMCGAALVEDPNKYLARNANGGTNWRYESIS